MTFHPGIVALICLAVPLNAWSAEITDNKKVLYVNSYHPGYAWSDSITDGIRKVFTESKVAPDLNIFYMDSKRNKEDVEQAAFKAKEEIETYKPDLVIISDDNATKFLLQPYYKNAQLPFVFCGLNWDASIYNLPYKNTTGMVEVALVPQIVKHLREYAKGERIGLIIDDTPSERKSVKYHQEILKINYEKVYFIKHFSDWKQKYIQLQDEVDMFIVKGHSGIFDWNQAEAQKIVMEHAKIPSGTMQNWTVPIALLGITKVPAEQGEWAAQAALQILQGTTPADIPITQNKKGHLVLNMKMSQKLGVVFNPILLEIADILH